MLIVIDSSGQAINSERIESVMIDVPPKRWIVTMFSGQRINVSDEVHEEIIPFACNG